MPIIEIRRHAERSDKGNDQGALSPAGRAMAEALAKRKEKYALVLSSPLPRAKETAQLIAGRLDAVESGLLPEMGGVIGDRIFGELRTLADWGEVLREREDARAFAVYGQNSRVGKILEIHQEAPGRIQVVLVRQSVGF